MKFELRKVKKPINKKQKTNMLGEIAPLFMVAQLPFNDTETVKLNTPMIEVMSDEGNTLVSTKNLKELGVFKKILKKDSVFLEIGCGSGYLLDSFYQAGGQGLYLGLEPIGTEAGKGKKRLAGIQAEKKAMLTKLSRKIKTISRGMKSGAKELITHGLIEKTEYPKNSLDYVYSYHVFEHLENPLVMYQKARQWLKPGGMLIITCPNVESAFARRDIDSWRCSLSSHRWLPGVSTIIRSADRHGFVPHKYFTYGGFPSPRSIWQDVLNYSYKIRGVGDVVCMALKKDG